MPRTKTSAAPSPAPVRVAKPGSKPKGSHRRRRASEEPADLSQLLQDVRRFARGTLADRTREEYAKQWATFERWCKAQGLSALPAAPRTLCLYLAHRARPRGGQRLSVATLSQGLSAIGHRHAKHRFANPLDAPELERTWEGIRRKLGTPAKQKAPATTMVVRAMVDSLPPGLLGVRDRALLALGFAGAFRRSELVGLDVEDLKFRRDGSGVEVTLGRSKTDQHGRGLPKEIARGRRASTCPVTALRDWLELAEITEGPVFRAVNRHGQVSEGRLTNQVVALVVKRALSAAGLPNEAYSAHSLRAGMVTQAKERGVDDADIMRLTGHRSLQTLHGYDRRAKRWANPASGRLDL